MPEEQGGTVRAEQEHLHTKYPVPPLGLLCWTVMGLPNSTGDQALGWRSLGMAPLPRSGLESNL